jgi:Na+-translocating ferredoxin:NAD+ oxidoreductase subunit G
VKLADAVGRNSIVLGLVALVVTLVLAGTQLLTREQIAAQQRAAEARAYNEILPPARYDNALLDDFRLVEDRELLGLQQPRRILVARRGGDAQAVIVPATAPDGYGGAIELIVGINADGTVAGVRVVAHKETPGLGDKIDARKSRWIDAFARRSLGDPTPAQWAVQKDGGAFDQFTGATITPRAVTAAVRRTLQYFEANREALLAAATTGSETRHE